MSSIGINDTMIRLLLAFVCGGMIGIERLMKSKNAGIRTHIIVCVGAALTVMVSFHVSSALGFQTDVLRLGAQVISGIGFLGVGTIIIKGHAGVMGLTTAAGLWTTSIVGLAIGAGFYEGAIIATALILVSLYVVEKIEDMLMKYKTSYELYLEIDNINNVDYVLEKINEDKENKGYSNLAITPPRSGCSGNAGVELSVKVDRFKSPQTIRKSLKQIEHVLFVLDSI